MEDEYDAIVLGTGLKECILSGLLSTTGYKVLHMDRNDYYGGEAASLNLNQLFARFCPGVPVPPELGPSRDYNVDLVPKFMMANGKLVRTLIRTDVTKYLEFKAVDGSYVLNSKKVYKVPASDGEALRSSLLGMFEKLRARGFFIYVQEWDPKDPATHKGYDLRRMTMGALFKEYKLDPQTVDFVGHAIALHRDDSYLDEPAELTVRRMQLYHESLYRYAGLTSPYIYPRYGLGELPQGFARLSAVYGGTYMLNRTDAKVAYDPAGVAIGVTAEGQTAKGKFVVGDPSYLSLIHI